MILCALNDDIHRSLSTYSAVVPPPKALNLGRFSTFDISMVSGSSSTTDVSEGDIRRIKKTRKENNT